MKKILPRILALSFTIVASISFVSAQSTGEDLFELSLNDLMNIEIVSASKKAENIFDTPVSSYSISHNEIVESGVTSIPEALRLCPGLIVRETTNGNYDIHIRGFENPARYTSPFQQMNLLTLVMIDNRPVFNYNQGGTDWEALPIDIIDVERIEVVKGPNAPLFGPNAVTGVINIITREPKTEGLYVSANVQRDNLGSNIGNIAVGQKLNSKLSYNVSANYQNRMRYDNLYYFYATDQFAENASAVPNASIAYPNPDQSLEKFGANAFVNYKITEEAGLALSIGLQDAEAQRPYITNETALSFNSNQSKYVNLSAYYKGLNAKISHNNGQENLKLGNLVIEGSTLIPTYDFDITDIVLDYQWEVSSKLSLRPGFNYQRATYDDRHHLTAGENNGLLNDKRTIGATAGSLRADYFPIQNLRVVAALRADKFIVPDKLNTSYQLASTYKINDAYLFRASHAKSNSGAFLGNTSLNINLTTDLGFAGPGTGPFVTASRLGNQDIDLTTVTSTEFGFRSKLNSHLQIDVEVFHQELEHVNLSANTERTFQPTGLPAPYPPFVPETIVDRYQNLPLTAIQNGMTISAHYVASAKFQFKPFVTFQNTKVKDLSLAFNTFPIDPITNPVNINSTIDVDHESTPKFYGGAFVNLSPIAKLNANVSTYFFGKHTLYYTSDRDPVRDSNVGAIDGKMLLNAKVSYQLIDKLKVYISGRNLLNNDSREYYGTDRIGGTYLAGLSYNF
ncbi:TonB-dependent receptor plug domain-containing protein [Catalinimonas niigatensis]|uniref:TonB-dependent receptor plug domain-containing protein n=1 Tax=Catalinimonas niigatensis TaxID=1397264 RepID=UPI0026657FF4|nr:TonB-dependent receptor plug domain-containing protein [Catalinimonas niigatensis]WPP51118.1 TonB-dependent receptor [Catalinimonas niigatensis]